jgi:hypothetical protein
MRIEEKKKNNQTFPIFPGFINNNPSKTKCKLISSETGKIYARRKMLK